MHIASRLLVGVTFLLTAVLNNLFAIALIQLFLIILILQRYQDGSSRALRALLLLRWLVVPIILLHTLFTPGAMIVSGMAWPISVEGIQSGLWLSFHLVVIFFSAMLFSMLLTHREWIVTALKVPWIGHQLLPYAILLDRCWNRIREMMSAAFSQWREDHKGVQYLVLCLAGLPSEALKVSRQTANEVWSNWDQSVNEIMTEKHAIPVSLIATLLALLSALLIGLVTIYGGL